MQDDAGRLRAIAIRERSGAAMQERDTLQVTCEAGLEGDHRGRPGKRQVTVLGREAWNSACAESKTELHWTVRRANLLLEGVDFADSRGQHLRVGEVLLEVTGPTEPCRRMDAEAPGLSDALAVRWRGGACCRVVEGGHIACGDPVRWEDR